MSGRAYVTSDQRTGNYITCTAQAASCATDQIYISKKYPFWRGDSALISRGTRGLADCCLTSEIFAAIPDRALGHASDAFRVPSLNYCRTNDCSSSPQDTCLCTLGELESSPTKVKTAVPKIRRARWNPTEEYSISLRRGTIRQAAYYGENRS